MADKKLAKMLALNVCDPVAFHCDNARVRQVMLMTLRLANPIDAETLIG